MSSRDHEAEFPDSLEDRAKSEMEKRMENRLPTLGERARAVLSTSLDGKKAPAGQETLRERQLRTAVVQGRRGADLRSFVRDPRTGNVLRADQYTKLAESRASLEGGEPIPPDAA